MTNTLENKAKLFAHYWGQEVLKRNDTDLFYVSFLNPIKDKFLLLKPISSVTDEDAIEISKIGNRTSDSFDKISDSQHLNYGKNHTNTYLSFLEVTDFLRSKGYALPYMGLSVEKQIEYAWIKLEEIKCK